MQTTAESESIPTKETVTSRLADATGHRVDELSTQYHRITGSTSDVSDPEEICSDLTEWVRQEESTSRLILDGAIATFQEISFGKLKSVFEGVWNGGQLTEDELVKSAVRQQAETYELVRVILAGDPSPWSQLESAGANLRDEHPDSPTTDSVETVLDASEPPSLRRVQQLIEEAKDPKPPGADDDAWAELQRVAEELRQELPNAKVTDEVTSVVDADDRPTDDRTKGLLSEANTVLERMRTVQETLDELEENEIVVIESSE
jgi:hypothetical protein